MAKITKLDDWALQMAIQLFLQWSELGKACLLLKFWMTGKFLDMLMKHDK
jgi:hypothetical protein